MLQDDERMVSPISTGEEEEQYEQTLRPQTFDQYIGQEKIITELSVYIEAAKMRKESLDHVLLHGPPGLGKTTLGHVIGNEMGVHVRTTSGPAIEKNGDLLAMLNELEPGDILFIDEIHRLPRPVEEMLYSCMEDFFVDIIVGEGPSAHPIHFPLPPFTLIGATTRAGALSAPLRDRFGIVLNMEYYSPDDLKEIVLRTSKVLEVDITDEGAEEIAYRSRGTPRITNRLLKRVRDFSEVRGTGQVTKESAKNSLELLRVDQQGLDATDYRLLEIIINRYDGGPVGLNTLAANLGEEVETVEDMVEPYLLQAGFINRTARGRMATQKSYEHLDIPYEL